MNRYEIVVVEIVSPSTAAKYRLESAPVIWKAAIISTVATSPDSRFIATGVPNLAENRPRTRGPPPSSAATASVLSEPMIQVVPALAASCHTSRLSRRALAREPEERRSQDVARDEHQGHAGHDDA